MKNFIVILLSLTLLFNCKKDGELNLTVNQYTRRLEGQWQIVSYKLNEENTLSFKEFLTSEIKNKSIARNLFTLDVKTTGRSSFLYHIIKLVKYNT